MTVHIERDWREGKLESVPSIESSTYAKNKAAKTEPVKGKDK